MIVEHEVQNSSSRVPYLRICVKMNGCALSDRSMQVDDNTNRLFGLSLKGDSDCLIKVKIENSSNRREGGVVSGLCKPTVNTG